LFGPFSGSVIDPENANSPRDNPIYENVRGSADHPFAGSCNLPGTSATRESGEQFGLFVNTPFDEF